MLMPGAPLKLSGSLADAVPVRSAIGAPVRNAPAAQSGGFPHKKGLAFEPLPTYMTSGEKVPMESPWNR